MQTAASASRAQATPGFPPAGLLGLLDIFEPARQVVVVEREPCGEIEAYLDAAVDTMGKGFRVSLEAGSPFPLQWLLALPGREALATDMDFLIEAYSDLLGCPAVGVRLEVMRRPMCPRFHVDHTGIRLLCTYRGPGTEWLEESCADRSRLGSVAAGRQDEASGIVRNPDGIHRTPPWALTLLKGSRWHGNTGRGAIHRSPSVAAEGHRVLLALDALW